MQQTELLSCNNCGRTIEVPHSANYATCARCGARLVIHRGETAHYTEVVAPAAASAERAKPTEAELSLQRTEMSIVALEREWEVERPLYLVRKGGRNSSDELIEPTLDPVKSIAAFCLILSLCSILFALTNPRTNVAGIVASALVFSVIMIGSSVGTFISYKRYSAAEKVYLDQRDKLLTLRAEQRRQLSLSKRENSSANTTEQTQNREDT